MRPVDSGPEEPAAGGRHPGWPARLGPLLVPVGRVALRPPRLLDGGAWSHVRTRDRAHLERWEPTSTVDWADRNTVLAWPGQWGALRGMARRGQALPFVITVDDELAGQVTIGNIVRGALRSAWIGYWVAGDRVRGGVASVAVALATDHAFNVAGLHRLEATVRPENAPSLRVLQKLGFREEGLFRRYLDVDGAWRDHLCFAITTEDAPEGLVARLIGSGRAQRP
ncbi:ribosomal-protein-alanine N-acetyltransferase [Longimycelium tulufanense]|uniref:Ribosomal-protein-alanine N-acetyltransferase n=1 Tax=Longimycelium tulufanense TaxID=907463 RepID=A0A8J3CK96_9PSEU|nr:ribosomal-protein-alanine N-acetyltransferase [Longimycelium tulufanense]